MYTYLLINLLSVSVPFVYSFDKRLNFYKTWYAFWPATIFTGAVFIIWDIIFTANGIWGFNPDYLTGINIVNLPIEEWLFFICIPYASVFTYASLKTLLKKQISIQITTIISWIIVIILILITIFFWGRLYTNVTYIMTAVLLVINLLYLKPSYLGYYYLAFIIIFAGPFLIVNGILTGLFISEPVVWYNNSENLGIRVFTIPVEDFIYGFLLLLMNINIYEWIISKRERNKKTG